MTRIRRANGYKILAILLSSSVLITTAIACLPIASYDSPPRTLFDEFLPEGEFLGYDLWVDAGVWIAIEVFSEFDARIRIETWVESERARYLLSDSTDSHGVFTLRKSSQGQSLFILIIPRTDGIVRAEVIDSFIDLTPGDYVVHINHGIGQFLGIERVKSLGIEKDYISIQYADHDKIFIPVEQLNFVQKYISSGFAKPRLDKIGARGWNKTRERVQRSIEELARVGARTFLRIGTCGTFQDQVKDGDMIIFDSAARYDGASKAYAPIEYPAVAHYSVIEACIQAARQLGIPFHVGTTRTHDGLYVRQQKPGGSFNGYWQSDWAHHYEDLKRLNVVASEMEASVILVLAKIWGLRAGGIATSVINVLNPSKDEGEYDPQKDFAQSTENIKNLALMGSEAIFSLAQQEKELT